MANNLEIKFHSDGISIDAEDGMLDDELPGQINLSYKDLANIFSQTADHLAWVNQ